MPRLQRKKNKKLKQAGGTPELSTGVQKGLREPKRGNTNKKNHCFKNKKAYKINVLNNNLNNTLEETSKSEMSLHSLSKTNVIQAKNKKKRKINKRNNRINKKFDTLINNLQVSLGTSITSIDSTVIEEDVSNIKRKNISIVSDSPKRKKSRQNISATSIVIKEDDEHNMAHCSKLKMKPLHCSTPIKTLFKKSPRTLVTIDLSEDGNPAVVNEPENGDNLNSDEDKKTDSDCAFVAEINKTIKSNELEVKEISDCLLVSENKTVISKEAGDKEVSDCVFVSEINKTDTEVRSNAVNGNEVSDCVFISDDRELESGEIAGTSDPDCVFVSAHNSTDSDDSDVTIIPNQENIQDKKIRKVVRGLAKLDESAKDKLLRLITQNIFTGCKKPKKFKNLRRKAPKDVSIQATEDDVFIKQVILGQSLSRCSVGSNIYNPARVKKRTGLRMVVIDGSNVAMSHGQHRFFSVKGLKICIDYFTRRGHAVKAFVPRFRCKFGKSTNPRLLDYLENQGLVVYTPSREIQGRQITSYDDRYIIQCAAEFDGVIVTGDNYRDLINENPKWRFIIENRLLPFTFVDDMIMFPKDPLGRNGPSLQTLLRH